MLSGMVHYLMERPILFSSLENMSSELPTRTCSNQPAQLQRQERMSQFLYEVSLRIIHVINRKRILKVLTRLHGRLVYTFAVRLQQSQVFSSRGPPIDMKTEVEHAQISKKSGF